LLNGLRTNPATLRGTSLATRLAAAAALLLLEKVVLNLFVDFDSAQAAQGLGAAVRVAQHWGFRFLVAFAIAAAVFGYLRPTHELQEASTALRAAPVGFGWLAMHGALVALLAPLSMSLYGAAARLPFPLVVAVWLSVALLAVGSLFMALAPWSLWRDVARGLGTLWWYATAAAAAASAAMGWSQRLWTGMARVTFEAVYHLLSWLVPTLQVDPSDLVIDTGRFAVSIDPVCSGLEGISLVLAFCGALLLLFRREFIFPRALILIPIGAMLSFALNVVRIAALVLIGDAGYTAIAVYGFHSQAGWIAFNGVAVAIAFVSLRSPWISRTAVKSSEAAVENPTAVYLLPYLALLLAGMVVRAASQGFERLDWLRLVAVGAALAYSWPRLRGLDWRCTWRGPAAGVMTFVLWIAAAQLMRGARGMPPELAALTAFSRNAWIALHLLVALAAVPVAEELAFRGYLLRRIRSADFETLSPGSAAGWPLLVGALAFGLCQGPLWLPGTIAGVIFGLVYTRTERMGEAVAAHAACNTLLAAAVLGGSQWQLW
jgi:exosortase E/protease (VPEID-CTERM system)